MKRMVVAGLAIAGLVAPAWGQDAEPDAAVVQANATKAVAEANTAAANQLKAEVEARAALARARIDALGLPKFDGNTELKDGAGEMEATQLGTYAVAAAARTIKGKLANQTAVAVMAADEALDLSLGIAVGAEMTAIEAQLNTAETTATNALKSLSGGKVVGLAPMGVSTGLATLSNPYAFAVAGIGAVAGLLRSDVTVTAVKVPAIDDAMMVRAVAGEIGSNAVVPSALLTTNSDDDLLTRFETIGEKADTLRARRAAVVQAAADAKKQKQAAAVLELLDLAIKRADAFRLRMTTPDAKGRLPIVEAAISTQLADGKRVKTVLRLHVDKAGGNLIERKNLGTFFGGDPLRVSSGLVVSYLATDPQTGTVVAGGTINCRTAEARLRDVQERTFATRDNDGKKVRATAFCEG